MTAISALILRGTAFLLAIAPVGACALPFDQSPFAPHPANGLTRQAFLKRHAAKLLARDTDGDGKVSQAEFLAATGKGSTAKRFTKMDRNTDGLLDTTEIDAMLTRRFTRLDGNGDGVLSAEERAAARAKTGKPGNERSKS